jgi:hypothetical protein
MVSLERAGSAGGETELELAAHAAIGEVATMTKAMTTDFTVPLLKCGQWIDNEKFCWHRMMTKL